MTKDKTGLLQGEASVPTTPKTVVTKRPLYYICSSIIFGLGAVYCFLVYFYSNYPGGRDGSVFLLGLPNYFFFYLTILPFMTAGVVYLATANTNIHFFGSVDPAFDAKKRRRVLWSRRGLLVLAVLCSVLVTVPDVADRGYVLPPYDLALASTHDYVIALNCYNQEMQQEKKWVPLFLVRKKEIDAKEKPYQDKYLSCMRRSGFSGQAITGFSTLSSWLQESSPIYKMETLLSWLGALVIAMFFAQLLLLMMVKDDVRPETKNLVVWLLILCSFWIPAKIFSFYYHSFGIYHLPRMMILAVLLFIIGVLLGLFLNIESDNMMNFAKLTGSLAFAAGDLVAVLRPEYYNIAIKILGDMGGIYGSILLVAVAFSIFVVTDQLIRSYERKADAVESK